MYNSLIGSRDKNLWTLEQNPPPETWSLIVVKICYGIPKFNNVFTGVRKKSDKSTISTYIILYDKLQSEPPIYDTAFKPAYIRLVLRFVQRKRHERKKISLRYCFCNISCILKHRYENTQFNNTHVSAVHCKLNGTVMKVT